MRLHLAGPRPGQRPRASGRLGGMQAARPLYDRIGGRYSGGRRPDRRIAARIDQALGAAASVVNVGAGTGSYEPDDRRVVAVEPSPTSPGDWPSFAGSPGVRWCYSAGASRS
jgi:hypothetical protein